MVICFSCECEAKFKCSKCKKAFYCCGDCQKEDWHDGRHYMICCVMAGENEDEDDIFETTLDEIDEWFEQDEDSDDQDEGLIAKRRRGRRKRRRKSRRRTRRKVRLSRAKARKMARETKIRGHPVTKKQRRWLWWVAGGGGR